MPRLTEIFASIQGEGFHCGTPMTFVRFQGCSVKCPIRKVCDEQDSLAFSDGGYWSVDEIVDICNDNDHQWVCITGGEPMSHVSDVQELVYALKKAGKKIMLQTSGNKEVNFEVDWLVVSPKTIPTKLVQRKGHELKLVYTPEICGVGIIDWGILASFYRDTHFHHYYLQEKWGKDLAQKAVMSDSNKHWRLSTQVHKYLELP